MNDLDFTVVYEALPYLSRGLQFSLMIDFSWKNCLVLCLGLAACAYCHVAFLREARLRAEARAIRILALQRDL